MQEASKALIRRLSDSRFATTYFRGDGIAIGAGDDALSKYKQQFPLMNSLKAWDLEDGDAQKMKEVRDNKYDFVHSSHCLEHLDNPYEAFKNWLRICKPGGYIITTVPDEDIYEQGTFPHWNPAHKTSWTILKKESWSPKSISVVKLLYKFIDQIEVLKIELINSSYLYGLPKAVDQTYQDGISECAIEFIVRKRTRNEIKNKGRYPKRKLL
ncbi:MAG: class I SAM-dependent methyltransferase, partial [Candidatus Moranbacteria bacterium]|nr:class I SAM-dependent methyltransferase [Candidatus Moranbacteria bacterium]